MSLDLDAIEQRALWEASEDRRIAGLMRQRRNRVTLEQRADAVEALVAEVKRLREDNAALVASKGDDWQTGYDTGCAMSHSIGCGAAQDHRDSLLAAVERVRELHRSDGEGWCAEDGFGWPCVTARALDGASS